MKSTRTVIGLAATIYFTGPLLGLGHLSRDIQFFEDFERAGYVLPLLTQMILPFGPLWWWSYLTPVALGVAVAGLVRTPISPLGLTGLLFTSVIQFLTIIAVIQPYFYLTKRMGSFATIYPLIPLMANLCLIGTSLGLAYYSISRLIARGRNVPLGPL
jgi:hypothetical protein